MQSNTGQLRSSNSSEKGFRCVNVCACILKLLLLLLIEISYIHYSRRIVYVIACLCVSSSVNIVFVFDSGWTWPMLKLFHVFISVHVCRGHHTYSKLWIAYRCIVPDKNFLRSNVFLFYLSLIFSFFLTLSITFLPTSILALHKL